MLSKLDQGYAAATDGPFRLQRSAQHRIDTEKWSWKIFSLELAIKYFTASGAADPVGSAVALVVDAEIKAPRKKIDVLVPKANPEIFRRALETA